jgi:hypothetical protein
MSKFFLLLLTGLLTVKSLFSCGGEEIIANPYVIAIKYPNDDRAYDLESYPFVLLAYSDGVYNEEGEWIGDNKFLNSSFDLYENKIFAFQMVFIAIENVGSKSNFSYELLHFESIKNFNLYNKSNYFQIEFTYNIKPYYDLFLTNNSNVNYKIFFVLDAFDSVDDIGKLGSNFKEDTFIVNIEICEFNFNTIIKA